MWLTKFKDEPEYKATKDALDFQKKAFDKIKDLEYAAIFHEQGLGKTKIAIDLLLYWFKKQIVDIVVIFTKKGLLYNWEKEIIKHSDIIPSIFSQNKVSNFGSFTAASRLFVGNFELLITEFERFKNFFDGKKVGVILDESTKIKNPKARITKYFFNFSKKFKKRIIMTGTPSANRPEDLWAQIKFLDDGESLGKDFKTFAKTVSLNNKLSKDRERQIQYEKNLENLKIKIEPFSVREIKSRSKEIRNLIPEKKIYNIHCSWENNQLEMYKKIREEFKAFVVKNGVPQEDNSQAILKRLLRLIQIISNPILVDEKYSNIPGKFHKLKEILKNIAEKKEKVIIWTSFVKNVNWLSKNLDSSKIVKVHGGLDMHTRNISIDSFCEKPEITTLIATPQSSKEGLTLTVANNVIFYDRLLSVDDYLQAQDRIHRLTQTKKCSVYNLLMKDSIDDWVNLLLKAKHLAAQLLLGDITREEYEEKIDYTFADILKKILEIK